jgi:hypothetical protein
MRGLVERMGSAARIKKGIYAIGNHDHTIWTAWLDEGLRSAWNILLSCHFGLMARMKRVMRPASE